MLTQTYDYPTETLTYHQLSNGAKVVKELPPKAPRFGTGPTYPSNAVEGDRWILYRGRRDCDTPEMRYNGQRWELVKVHENYDPFKEAVMEAVHTAMADQANEQATDSLLAVTVSLLVILAGAGAIALIALN